jgi:ApbE superfamily uncharacterized protein (UPF0280 family)
LTENPGYTPRIYRETMGNERWKSFRSVYLETDLWIAVDAAHYSPAMESFSMERIIHYRTLLNEHIIEYPDFLISLVPLIQPPVCEKLISGMYLASQASGTGPMSAVAGSVAEFVCNDIYENFNTDEAIVENGGDIFLRLKQPATISVYAGRSPLSDKTGLIIKPEITPLSVCCSSATVGHSLSLGTADACVIACRSGALADAYATACCNSVKSSDLVQEVTERYLQKTDVLSVIIIKDDKVAMGGEIEITVF